jgi:putative phage-type endonuclease
MALDPRREGRLTASNFGAAIGLNPYRSKQKLYRDLKGLEPKFEGNAMTEWGNTHEMDAVNAYEADQGAIVTKCGDEQEFVIDPVRDWMGCTPDGFNTDGIVVEVKCPYATMYADIPRYYMAQIQGQMHITGLKQCDFVAWYMEDKEDDDLSNALLQVWRVEISDAYVEEMLNLLDYFWHENVLKDVQPKRKAKPAMPLVEYNLLF